MEEREQKKNTFCTFVVWFLKYILRNDCDIEQRQKLREDFLRKPVLSEILVAKIFTFPLVKVLMKILKCINDKILSDT